MYENAYQRLHHDLVAGQRAANTNIGEEQRKQLFTMYELLRMAHLRLYLWQREPDSNIGYSILIYRLSDAVIEQATLGPPVDLLHDPEPDAKEFLIRRMN